MTSRESGNTSHVLPAERASATFDVAKLQKIVSGDRPTLRDSFKPLFDGPEFNDDMDDYLGYPEFLETQLKRAASAIRVVRENPKLMINHQAQKVQMGDLFSSGSMGIHFVAYLPFLQTNASDEQKKVWLPGAISAEYFGAYAQTELGHGSNVRALETTATYDKNTQEFIIDSPTLTSMKWWPTGMYACTHGVVFAQLILDGQNHGVFGFFMQFRDENGMLMPGVEIGEIGPKLSQNEANIGYGRFDHVRVPHFNMFAKHAKVTLDGKFVPAPPRLSKFKYVGMMNIRAMLVGGASRACAKAATIAIRYSCIRKQGFKDSKSSDASAKGENAIMDYRFQQYRLFKVLGTAYLFMWSGRAVNDYLKRVVDAISGGDEAAADEMPDLHATCAGLKSICTTVAAVMVEDARKACGGQGFLRSSGVADLTSDYVGAVTAEGEAVILSLQTARFLIKGVAAAKKGQPLTPSSAYLADAPMTTPNVSSFANQRGLIVQLMKERARQTAYDLEESFSAAIASGLSFDEALNSVMVQAWNATEYHCYYTLTKQCNDSMAKYVTDSASNAAVNQLIDLVLLQNIYEKAGAFVGVLTREHLKMIMSEINRLLTVIRPNAVALGDAFGFSDHSLASTIGRFDGNVYEAIYAEAKRSPLNQNPRMVAWDELKEVLNMDFIREQGKKQRVDSAAAQTAKL